jgi:hypothetical protein
MRNRYVYTNVQDVRKAALESILTTHATLPDIIRRVRDTSEDVRKYAFEVSVPLNIINFMVVCHHRTAAKRCADYYNNRLQLLHAISS